MERRNYLILEDGNIKLALQHILLMDKENHRPISVSGKCVIESKIKSQNLRVNSSKKSLPKNEGYQLYMKYLISANSDYFQNKMRANPIGRSKEVQFKVPSATGMTVYKRDFHKKQNKYHVQEGIKHNMSVDCIKTNNFLRQEPIDLKMSDKTMYQSDFKHHPITTDPHRKLKKRLATTVNEDDEAPRFLETQNRLDFLNWAGKNYVPSMKPEQSPAVTIAPFDGKSVYKSDFEGKTVSPTALFVRQPALLKFGCSSPMMKTSYNDDYPQKMSGVNEIDCKPKYFQVSICKRFKGTTEYKREFLKNRKVNKEEQDPCLTVEELQTLIIDL